MRYLHTMLRITDIEKSLFFYETLLGLKKVRQNDYPEGKFTLIFLAPEDQPDAQIELTYNWNSDETYDEGRHFGHLAYEVDDIYALCQKLQDHHVIINRPPRDGRMAFVRSPDNISIELLQKGDALAPKEPWSSMKNTGHW